MINILLEGYRIDAPWLCTELKKYLKPHHKVSVIPFSFRDAQVSSLSDWNNLYGKKNGNLYRCIVSSLTTYGISEDNISFINYFTDTKDSAAHKIKNSDIIYFTGGLPDKMMERIRDFALHDVLSKYNGIVMGYSAGAMIQLSEYHLSPDHDYPEFGYYEGLPYLSDFYLEIHYNGNDEQNASIQRVLAERRKTVYATSLMSGAIIVDNGIINLIGKVEKYTPERKAKQ